MNSGCTLSLATGASVHLPRERPNERSRGGEEVSFLSAVSEGDRVRRFKIPPAAAVTFTQKAISSPL